MKPSEYWGDDRTEREFEECGLQCCTRTQPMGHRCGYVSLPEGHPLFGKDCDACYGVSPDLDVDGGITFANGTEKVWILGWDAAHVWHIPDVSLMDERYREVFDRYGSLHEEIAYMVDADTAEYETRRFARQLAALREEGE